MSILTVTSENPDLSYILSKNPATILSEKKPFERELRKGRVYGWFTDKSNKEFRLLFVDSPVVNSFSENEDFEYLDINRYSNPYIPILMINTALNSAASKEHEKDIEKYRTSVSFTIKCPLNILIRFQNMKDIELDYSLICNNHFQVTIISNGVMQALNLSILLCVIACFAYDDVYVPLPEAGISKYLKVLNRASAPYYLRHLFISRAITNFSLFKKLEPQIQTSTMNFKFGNTQVQRFNAIKEALFNTRNFDGSLQTCGTTLLDIGCGEMHHTLKLSQKYEHLFAYDANNELTEINQAKIKKRGIENITACAVNVTGDWVKEELTVTESDDVLLSEVLEHMNKKDAMNLVSELLKTDANRIVITVPNKNFNQYYNITEEDVRHRDHKWEPTREELAEFIQNLVKGTTWSATFHDVGDSITENDTTESISFLVNIKK